MRRLVVVAGLKRDSGAKAAQLIDAGPPFDPAALGLEHHGVYVSNGDVVFVFEGPAIDSVIEEIVGDPSRSSLIAHWAELLEGAPRIAREAYRWDQEGGRAT